MKEPPHPVLAQGKVRHVGDQVALVVAETADAGQGRGRADRGRLRGAAGGHRHRERARRHKGSVHDEVADNVCYDWGHGDKDAVDAAFKTRRARQHAGHRQQPADPERDGAARRQRELHPARRKLHAVRREPEPARRAAADVRLRARPARVQGARDRARCRRRLRLEDLPVRRRRGAGLGQQARRPADQVDRRAQRVLPDRRARPRPRHQGRTGDGRQGQLPGAARQDDRQHGRLPVDLRVERADHPVRDAARRPVQDAGDLRRGQGGVHQHRAGRRLPRRRPARGDLRGRAHRRAGGARPEDGPGRRSGARTSSPSSRTPRRSA